MKGSEFAKQVWNVADPQRSVLALQAMLAGNMPSFLFRDRIEVVTEAVIDGLYYRGVYGTLPNYLAVGEDDDWTLWPLTIIDLQRFCDAQTLTDADGKKVTKFFIPPAKLIYRNWLVSACKVLPQTIYPGHYVGPGTEAIVAEDRMIKDAMRAKGCPIEAFIRAKKAYNSAPNVHATGGPVGNGYLHFSGWYYPGGNGLLLAAAPEWGLAAHPNADGGSYGHAIQGHDETGGHEASFADYSHGCDLVYWDMTVNGRQYAFDEVCMHPKLWVLVSDQGPFNPRWPSVGEGPPPSMKPPPSLPPASAPPSGFSGQSFITKASTLVEVPTRRPSPPVLPPPRSAAKPSGLGASLAGIAFSIGLGAIAMKTLRNGA
jgi:hypothetical protein